MPLQRFHRTWFKVLSAAVLGGFGGYALVACNGDSAPGTASSDAAVDGSSSPSADAFVDAPHVRVSPDGGRATAAACGNEAREPGYLRADAGGCTADVECEAGVEGRCIERAGPAICTYHACLADTDCAGATSVCGCGVGWARQNLCLTNSTCRTNSDCPGGERCVLSDPPVFRAGMGPEQGNEVGGVNYSGDALGYFCTTPQDDCNCPTERPWCIYNINAKFWRCGYAP